ncbi:response regulator [Antrihabitans cavernicola]|uniref:Response regulator transcription factor n=1 Tax=Antrihabitans cavernicola TaxID=2495913 RepID=A0A5A7SAX7_9NOCA|nr:response regulator transcription factor [Spelaeibacter cavernicola]KAA0021723.1 response regulator transcription factor [Spelaeibacter cavernicola]
MGPPTTHVNLTPAAAPTVLIVDDHHIFSELLGDALAANGMHVVGRCATLAAALESVAAFRPDVVVLDHNLPAGNGIGGVATIKRTSPHTRVLMLTAIEQRSVVQEAMDAGCDGFVTKRHSLADVIAAVESVVRGETPISPDVAGSLLGRRSPVVGGDLSRREADILQLIGAGLTNNDIAGQLRISVNTVRNHVQHVLTKLDAHSKLEAVAIAARHGLLTSDRANPGPQ